MQDRILNQHERDIFDRVMPILEKDGYQLVDVVMTKQDGQAHLTLFVYAHENMSVEDMANISGKLDGVLDNVEFLDDYICAATSIPRSPSTATIRSN